VLLLITICLMVTQEIGARTGAVTGKGLAALIRENYGVKITFGAMLALLIANQATTVSEFAGVAAALGLFGVPRLVSVPLAALFVWLLVTRGNYKIVERVFLVFSVFYLTYVVSGLLVDPPWGQIALATITPSIQFTPDYLVILVALIGTTITPWGQFFIQAYVVDKGVTPEEYPLTRVDVLVGAWMTDIIALFIIIATAGTLYTHGIRINDAADAARALEPLAGHLASAVFGIGLLNASLLAASIVPLASAYAVCEAFGWEAGVSKSLREAPAFNGLYTATVAIGALIVLVPGLDLIVVMLVAQTVNGILLPAILVFSIQLAGKPRLMGKYANGPILRAIAWATAGAAILATAMLLGATALGM
jgi:Mn2+/Fe2+ NRAMP family transporter